jgi:hypothetical protein
MPTDDGWIEPDESLRDVVEFTFEVFPEAKLSRAYSQTAQAVRATYQSLGPEFDAKEVKKIVSRPVYAGRPAPGADDEDRIDDMDNVEYDESIQIIDLDDYRKTEEKFLKVREHHSPSDGPDHMSDLTNTFGLQNVIESIPWAIPACPECKKKGNTVELSENGRPTRDVDFAQKQYKCPECGSQPSAPTKTQHNRLTRK